MVSRVQRTASRAEIMVYERRGVEERCSISRAKKGQVPHPLLAYSGPSHPRTRYIHRWTNCATAQLHMHSQIHHSRCITSHAAGLSGQPSGSLLPPLHWLRYMSSPAIGVYKNTTTLQRCKTTSNPPHHATASYFQGLVYQVLREHLCLAHLNVLGGVDRLKLFRPFSRKRTGDSIDNGVLRRAVKYRQTDSLGEHTAFDRVGRRTYTVHGRFQNPIRPATHHVADIDGDCPRDRRRRDEFVVPCCVLDLEATDIVLKKYSDESVVLRAKNTMSIVAIRFERADRRTVCSFSLAPLAEAAPPR
jgi:hypothetical protein